MKPYLTQLFKLSARQMHYVLLFIVTAWLISAISLGREYPATLRQALFKRKLSGVTLSFEDEASQSVLRQALTHTHPGVTLYALNTLEESKSNVGLLTDVLPDLLNHPAVEMRLEALRRIEQYRLGALREAVEQRLKTDPVPAVQAAALQALAATGQHGAIEQIYPYLDQADAELRQAAIIGLLRYSSVEVGMMAEGKLLQLALSENFAERTQAAEIIGEVKLHNLQDLLAQLLQDRNLRVRRAALTAAGKAKYPQLWPGVVAAITVHETGSAAAAALVAGGEAALPAMREAFARPNQNREVLMRLARVAGRIGGQNGSSLLLERLDHPEAGVRTQIVMALGRSGYRAEQPADQLRIGEQINAEVGFSAETLAARLDVGDGQPASLLTDALTFQLAQARTRLFWLLSFVYDRQTVRRAWDNLLLPAADKKAYALELLDTILPSELIRLLFPLLEELSPHQRWQRLEGAFPQPRLEQEQRLYQLLTCSNGRYSPWLLACTLHTIGLLRLSTPEMTGAIMAIACPAGNCSLVGDTAAWALTQFDQVEIDDAIARLGHEATPELIETAKLLESAKIGGQPMLSTVERVLVLKTVNLFSNTPDEILAEVATLLEEMDLLEGQTIFEKGSSGDCMYIVVSGWLKAHDGHHLLNYLYEGDVFGEMALLSPEPRLASITAIEDTHLLRLDQEPFYELMDDHIEVAWGVIQVLSGHLRNRVQDVTELKARVNELEANRIT